jgi:4-amino-4-deoxy-L-arabinose transferase-like glycosyltransferase
VTRTRAALAVLLAATAALYLLGLGASGWANAYYAAAAQAGSVSWKAVMYGSLDAANAITVDKPPASLWVMATSVRLFGLSPWSILAPQALEGVATVGLLYAAVRRCWSPAAGLLAGAALAVTPVAALVFRFNNPDALLVLLLTAAAYATIRALEGARASWLVLAGSCVGLGFLTKQLQALLVAPALAAAYLQAAPTSLRRRIGHLALAGLALVVSCGWWVALVALVPDANRPFVGGSQANSILELTFGYNGLGRLINAAGQGTSAVAGTGVGRLGGEPGWARLLGTENGGQVAWLLPAALVLAIAGLWRARQAPRTDRARAALTLWSAWLVVTGLVFSFMQGLFHVYYDVALAPPIAALVGGGATTLWRWRHRVAEAWTLAGTLALTAVWSHALLARPPDRQPWLRVAVAIAGLGTAATLGVRTRSPPRTAVPLAALGIAAALAGPLAFALETAARPHSGPAPSAGPAVHSGRPRLPVAASAADPAGRRGLIGASTPGPELLALLERHRGASTWVAAVVGAGATRYQLATGDPVMAVGGFQGTDPFPTLAQFQQYVRDREIRFFIAGPAEASADRGGRDARQIVAWVALHFTATTVDGTMVYDLTRPEAAASAGQGTSPVALLDRTGAAWLPCGNHERAGQPARPGVGDLSGQPERKSPVAR